MTHNESQERYEERKKGFTVPLRAVEEIVASADEVALDQETEDSSEASGNTQAKRHGRDVGL